MNIQKRIIGAINGGLVATITMVAALILQQYEIAWAASVVLAGCLGVMAFAGELLGEVKRRSEDK